MKLLLAVSGGIDSMCMADKFYHAGYDIAIAHCNFHLRGQESDEDSRLVEQWAEDHGIELFRADFDTRTYAKEHGISIEMAARELRYQWFAQTAVEHSFDAVAVAHNADDNAETFLLNLVRGTGGRGLRGMKESSLIPGTQVKLLRPMLNTSRTEIEEYAAAHSVPYRTDSSNLSTVYKRNMLRHKTLPIFKEMNPSFLKTMASNMEHIAMENEIANEYFNSRKSSIITDSVINLEKLLEDRHWRYLLFRLTEEIGLSSDALEGLAGLIVRRNEDGVTFAGKTFHGERGSLVTAAGSILMVHKESICMDVIVDSDGDYLFSGRQYSFQTVDYKEGMKLKTERNCLIWDADALPYPFILRRWKDGDWMRPFGMKGKKKKLSDIFTDLKMCIPEKNSTPVISFDDSDQRHIAVLGTLRMDNELSIDVSNTRKIIRMLDITK